MDSGSLWAFLACAFGAEVLGTMAGFGAATVLTPVATFFLDVKTAVAIVACFHLLGNVSRLWFFGRQINWTIAAQFGLSGVAASFAGAQAAAWLSADHIRMALGAFLIAYATLTALRVTTLTVPATPRTLVVGGLLSGAIAGVIGTGGAVRSVCLLAFGLPKEAYLGTSALIALAVDATRLPVYLTQQFIPSAFAGVVVLLIPVAFAGAWLGQRLVRKVSPVRFQQFVLVMLLVLGVKVLIEGLRGIG